MKGGGADSFLIQHDMPSIFAGRYDPSFPLAPRSWLVNELMAETADNGLTLATHDRFTEATGHCALGAAK